MKVKTITIQPILGSDKRFTTNKEYKYLITVVSWSKNRKIDFISTARVLWKEELLDYINSLLK